MTVISDRVIVESGKILGSDWKVRNGRVVPNPEDVYPDQAVKLSATYLYADLAKSSEAAQKLFPEVTGKIIRCYLDAASRLIKWKNGEIRSFDGDRVMGIFIGDHKCNDAVRAGFAINWAVEKVLRPKFAAKWPTLKDHWTLHHGIGIDAGEALLIRGGVRGDHDLVSIGSAPNVAAKLSGLRGTPDMYATDAVHGVLSAANKTAADGRNMWSTYPAQTIGGKTFGVKGSAFHWQP